MVWGKLDGAHGALGVDEHRPLDPSRAAGRARAVELGARVEVGGGDLLPHFDGPVEGCGREDCAELGVGPAHF